MPPEQDGVLEVSSGCTSRRAEAARGRGRTGRELTQPRSSSCGQPRHHALSQRWHPSLEGMFTRAARLPGSAVSMVSLSETQTSPLLTIATPSIHLPRRCPLDPLQIFSFHFWSDSKNPLGPSWTLSPEPPVNWPPPPDPSASSSLLGDLVQSWSSLFSFSTHSSSLTPSSSLPEDNFYLGYSIESVCSLRPVVPASERRRQAYLFAKHSWFFQNDQYAWSDEILEAAKEEANLTLLAACIEDEGMEVPRAVTRLGERLEQEEFWRTVGEGVVMVGVGGQFSLRQYGPCRQCRGELINAVCNCFLHRSPTVAISIRRARESGLFPILFIASDVTLISRPLPRSPLRGLAVSR